MTIIEAAILIEKLKFNNGLLPAALKTLCKKIMS